MVATRTSALLSGKTVLQLHKQPKNTVSSCCATVIRLKLMARISSHHCVYREEEGKNKQSRRGIKTNNKSLYFMVYSEHFRCTQTCAPRKFITLNLQRSAAVKWIQTHHVLCRPMRAFDVTLVSVPATCHFHHMTLSVRGSFMITPWLRNSVDSLLDRIEHRRDVVSSEWQFHGPNPPDRAIRNLPPEKRYPHHQNFRYFHQR